MNKITHTLLILIISITSLSTCYADWYDNLLRAFQAGETTLDLSHQNINDYDVKLIAEALTLLNCKLTDLNLEDNNISDEGARLIAKSITSPNCKLSNFNLRLNNNRITGKGDSLIQDALGVLKLKAAYISQIESCIFDGSLRYHNRKFSPKEIQEICTLRSINKLTLINCKFQENIPPFPDDYPASIINLSGSKFCLDQDKRNCDRLARLFLLLNLRNLNLSDCKITALPLFNPVQCQLTTLCMANNNLNTQSVQLIGQLPLLEVVDLSSCQLTQVPKFKNQKLITVKLDQNDFSESRDDLTWLFEHATLEKLILDNCKISHIEFDPAECNLKHLSLKGNKIDADTMAKIARIATLEELVLEDCGLEDDTVRDLILVLYGSRKSSKIWKLNLSGNKLDKCAELEQLFKLDNLKMLALSNCSIARLPMSTLKNSCIENLNISRNSIDDQSIIVITSMPKLVQLEINNCEIITQKTIQALLNTSNLEVLNMNACNIKHIDLLENSQNSKIVQLYIANNPLDENSFKAIAQLPQLIKLNIRKCNPNQPSLAHVFGIRKLKYLEIGQQELQDNWTLKKGGVNIQEIEYGFKFYSSENDKLIKQCIEEVSWLPNLRLLSSVYFSAPTKFADGAYHQQRIKIHDKFKATEQERSVQKIQNREKSKQIQVLDATLENIFKQTINMIESGGQ